eukprot:5202642-Alexandrium_andersonii.AAC.1
MVRCYVGNGPDFNVRDPDERGTIQKDPLSGCNYSRSCTGQSGFMQRAMIDASRRSGSRKAVTRESNRDKWL